MTITFDEYDKELERFEKIDLIPTYPTFEQIEMFKKDPEKWLLYCCFVLEKAEKPVTNEEKYSKRNLSDFVNNNLELVESGDESVNPE